MFLYTDELFETPFTFELVKLNEEGVTSDGSTFLSFEHPAIAKSKITLQLYFIPFIRTAIATIIFRSALKKVAVRQVDGRTTST